MCNFSSTLRSNVIFSPKLLALLKHMLKVWTNLKTGTNVVRIECMMNNPKVISKIVFKIHNNK